MPALLTVGARRHVLGLAVALVALAAAEPSAVNARAGAKPRLVARATGVETLLGLGRVVIYGRNTPSGKTWFRVVEGRRKAATGLPSGAWPESAGRDRSGRVVVTAVRSPAEGGPPVWWLYDPVRDVARRITIRTAPGCSIDALTVWRSRSAFAETCNRQDDGQVDVQRIVVREGRRRTMSDAPSGGFDDLQLSLRDRALSAVVSSGDSGFVRRLEVNGRWCPRNLHTVDLHHNTLGPIAVRGRELVWGAAVPVLQDFRLETFALSRPCGTDPRLRQMPMKLPSPPLRAVALGAGKLYFATDTAVYQQTLTRPAPPPPVRRSPGYLVPGWPTEVDAALGGSCCRIP